MEDKIIDAIWLSGYCAMVIAYLFIVFGVMLRVLPMEIVGYGILGGMCYGVVAMTVLAGHMIVKTITT